MMSDEGSASNPGPFVRSKQEEIITSVSSPSSCSLVGWLYMEGCSGWRVANLSRRMAWAGSFAVGGLHCAAGWATRIVGDSWWNSSCIQA